MIKPYYDCDGITIYHGDCREVLPTLPKFDLLLTDPPYGIGYSCGKVSTGKWPTKHHGVKIAGDDRDFEPSEWLSITKNQIMWGANYYSNNLPKSGWLVWNKRRGVEEMEWNRSDAELAFCSGIKTVKMFHYLWHGLCRDGEIGEHLHPTQKPLALMRWCLSFAPDAKTILDPFMGSGTTLVAAKREGRQATGIELEERYCEAAVKRLRQGVLF